MAFDYDAGNFTVQVAVAVGTLAITGVAVYEILTARRERSRADGRELVNTLYAPLRQHLLDLSDVERHFEHEAGTSPEESDRRKQRRWSVVSHRVLHLMRLVPRKLAGTLNGLERREDQLQRGWPALRNGFDASAPQEAKRLLEGRREGKVQVRILDGDAVVEWVDPRIAWVQRRRFGEWLDDWLLVRGLRGATVELMVAGYTEGGHQEADQVLNATYARLDHSPAVCRFRDEMVAVVGLASEALKQVDAEIARLSE